MQILYFNLISQLLSLAYFDGFQIVAVSFIAKFSQQQNLARRFGTSKIHLIPPPPCLGLLSVQRRWFCCY